MVELYSFREIEKIKRACCVVVEVLMAVSENIKPGITGYDIDMIARDEVRKRGGKPAFLNYKPPFSNRGFPASICVSINEEVVHGLPKKNKPFREGDLVSLDFGVIIDGYAGDAAITVPVGNISEEDKKLLTATKEALNRAVDNCVAGNWMSDIVEAIHSTAERYGVYPVRNYGGHGIGKKVHQEPFVPNHRKDMGKTNLRLRQGLVIAIEPMFSTGTEETITAQDGWTVITKDGSKSAHFEYTVAITENGPLVLTEI